MVHPSDSAVNIEKQCKHLQEHGVRTNDVFRRKFVSISMECKCTKQRPRILRPEEQRSIMHLYG